MANSCNKLMKEAIDVAVNEFRGIEFTYKLDDVLDSLSPNQKFSSNQLKGYLLKQGVSPKEIKQSGIFEGMEADNRAISAEDWLSMSGKQKITTEDPRLDHYRDITLGRKGADNPTYKELLSTVKAPKNNVPREPHFNVNDSTDGEKSLLGWRRTHVQEIEGKPTLVLNEFQSDWAQTERANRGTFESSIDPKRVETHKSNIAFLEKKLSTLQDELSSVDNQISAITKKKDAISDKMLSDGQSPELLKEWQSLTNEAKELKKYKTTREYEALQEEFEAAQKELKASQHFLSSLSKNVTADFPMSEIKHHQFQIVGAIDDALKQGINTIAIPIQRENELVGTAGVTKFYEQLNKKVLPDIRKRLEKQGMRIKVSMEDYGSSELKPHKDGGSLGLTKERPIRDNLEISHLSDAELHDALNKVVKDIRNELFSSRLRRESWEKMESRGVDIEGELFHKLLTGKYLTPYARNLPSFSTDFFNSSSGANTKLQEFLKAHIPGTPANRLHILEIEEVPNARVKWDVYGLLASLGLGGLASQSEAAEPISTTSGIAPRETNSMMETMRLEGQPNIFRLQDLATGRTQVSKAKPKEKEILDYFSQKESKGDYNAKSTISSAYGKYQFLKDTLAEKARLHGMTVKEARTPQGQEELMRKVLKDYEARLRKFDLPITKENLFVVHNLGETGGIRAIRGTYTTEDVERMRNNIPGTKAERNSLSKSEVVKEYYKMHKVTKGS